jgi:hypothetical protein
MIKYFYTEDIVKNSNHGLRSSLEQFVNSNFHEYTEAEQLGGAFTIYLEFRNLPQENCANTMRKFVEQLDDIQSEEDRVARNYAWFLQPAFTPGNIFATIIVFGNDNYAWHIIQKFEDVTSILPERKYLADLTIRVSGLFPEYRNRG